MKGDRDITKNNFKRIGKRNKKVKTVRLLLSSICLQYRKLSWNHPHWKTCSFELAWLIISILSRRKMAWDYHICTVVVVVVFDFRIMMTSSNGNIFHVTGHLCGEFTGPGEFPPQRPVTRSFDVFFDLRLNKRLSKQSWGWWFETLSRPFWRHHNDEQHFTAIPWNVEPLRLGNREKSAMFKSHFISRLWNYMMFSTRPWIFFSLMSRKKGLCYVETSENFIVLMVKWPGCSHWLNIQSLSCTILHPNQQYINRVYQLIQKQLLYQIYAIKAIQTTFQFANAVYKYLPWYL